MFDIESIEIYVDRKMLFNRDVFRRTCNLQFKKEYMDILYLF